MNNKENFLKMGFDVIDNNNIPQFNNIRELRDFIKNKNLDNVDTIKKLDNNFITNILKNIAYLPIDEKVNGYGLNFVGRNIARAKYAQKTDKELKINTQLSKDINTTENLVLKGDNLDCLKILKNYYSGKIKCIYIDPPYNTDSDEFVYPDKFDREEAEVLGLQNLSDDDFARMEFAFKTKKSHNGWLTFMYPRLLLARDLLSDDGVIFISIDDNEQANLKLLCDEIFGEENFVCQIIWKKKQGGGNDSSLFITEHEYIIAYSKNICFVELNKNSDILDFNSYPYEDEKGKYNLVTLDKSSIRYSENLVFEIIGPEGEKYYPRIIDGKQSCWRWSKKKVEQEYESLVFKDGKVYTKFYIPDGYKNKSLWIESLFGRTASGKKQIKELFESEIFSYPKPVELLKQIIKTITCSYSIILDFFSGSGTTGHAVMELNAEDGGNRKFILCQIDEPIKEDKPAYNFCVENNLPPVISSITIERLRRAGEKIKKEIEEKNSKVGLFQEKKQIPDIGFKVFDTVDAPKLETDNNGNILFPEINIDPLSRIYNMIFTVGLDEPTQVLEEVVKDCVYRIGNNYYITNSEKVTKEQFAECIKNGKVFIDGWTASLNATLQHYKEDVKIVF